MDIEAVKSELKSLKAEKGQIARQFKQVESGSAEHAALIEQMQQVSSRVKDLETEQKRLLKAQNEDEEAASPVRVLPGQFAAPEEVFQGDFSVSRLAADAIPDAWWHFVDEHKQASVYHSRAVWDFLRAQPHTSAELLLAKNDKDQIVGGLPLIFMVTPLMGTFAVSLPFFNYGGPLTRFTNVFDALLEVCDTESKKEDIKYIEVRTLAKVKFEASTKKVSMLRAMPDTYEQFDKEIGTKIRAQVKKGDTYQPRLRIGGIELLDDYYEVFAQNMRDLGTPVDSKAFFEALLKAMPEQCHIAVAYINDKPVATGFLLEHGKMMEIPWASTLREANSMNMNMWLYDRILKFSIDRKMHWFDFGRSTQDAGTYRFKKQWGAEPQQHYWYNFSKEAGGDSLNPDNPKFKMAIAVWQRLPVWLTKIIGPYVARQLP